MPFSFQPPRCSTGQGPPPVAAGHLARRPRSLNQYSPLAVGIENGESARHSTPSHSAWRDGSSRSRRERGGASAQAPGVSRSASLAPISVKCSSPRALRSGSAPAGADAPPAFRDRVAGSSPAAPCWVTSRRDGLPIDTHNRVIFPGAGPPTFHADVAPRCRGGYDRDKGPHANTEGMDNCRRHHALVLAAQATAARPGAGTTYVVGSLTVPG